MFFTHSELGYLSSYNILIPPNLLGTNVVHDVNFLRKLGKLTGIRFGQNSCLKCADLWRGLKFSFIATQSKGKTSKSPQTSIWDQICTQCKFSWKIGGNSKEFFFGQNGGL